MAILSNRNMKYLSLFPQFELHAQLPHFPQMIVFFPIRGDLSIFNAG